MTDYIKREDAKDAVINIVGWEKIAKYVDEMSKHFFTKNIDYYDALMDAEDVIADLPSADVAPVRHGRWIDKIYGGKECSECGYIWLDFGCPKYCPKCGARMDGERKNDDKSCDTCKHYDKGWDDIICDGCTKAHSNWERKDDE